jgi:hypothetical protein
MEEAFGAILIGICVVAIVIALLSYRGTGTIYKNLGRTGEFALDDERERKPEPKPQSPAASAEAREEVRQMLEAKSARRERRGEPALDVDAELEILMKPVTVKDAALREEIRQHVIARNERRLRQGKEPFDVEAEVERNLRELG